MITKEEEVGEKVTDGKKLQRILTRRTRMKKNNWNRIIQRREKKKQRKKMVDYENERVSRECALCQKDEQNVKDENDQKKDFF